MANKLNYDSKSLLNIKFSPDRKGYDSLEVDQTLDKVIQDYQTLNAAINDLSNKLEKQEGKAKELKGEVDRLTFELASLQKKFDALKKVSNVNGDNYTLVNKVAAYERVLHRKGINLKKALSDPDNC